MVGEFVLTRRSREIKTYAQGGKESSWLSIYIFDLTETYRKN